MRKIPMHLHLRWAHGTFLREPRAEAITKKLCRDIAKPYWWAGGHKPWKFENHWSTSTCG